MGKLRTIVRSIGFKVMAAGLYFTAIATGSVSAQLREGVDSAQPDGAEGNLMDIFTTIANILLFILGAVAVIMLIIGGFRYVVSGGDSSAVEGAKNTILYAIIGIIVAFLAFAAVNFVVDQLES